MNKLTFIDGIEFNKNDLINLYDDVGWSAYTDDIDVLIKSIKNSLKVISVWDKDILVGLIRVVGDGYSIIYIQDILVLENYQRLGIGKKLISLILDEYKNVRQKVLSTDAVEKNISFYESNGFKKAQECGCISFVKLN